MCYPGSQEQLRAVAASFSRDLLINNLVAMWHVSIIEDPLELNGRQDQHGKVLHTCVVYCILPLAELLQKPKNETRWMAFQEGGRPAMVALADFYARRLSSAAKDMIDQKDALVISLEPLDWTTLSTSRSRRRNRAGNKAAFMMERSDVFCKEDFLHVYARLFVHDSCEDSMMNGTGVSLPSSEMIETATRNSLARVMLDTSNGNLLDVAMHHVATAVLQEQLRAQLIQNNAVAFVADTSILPRKSGASHAPMESPPAVAFQAPEQSELSHTLCVDMGLLKGFLKTGLELNPFMDVSSLNDSTKADSANLVHLAGMLVPKGITLIVGGGYHGKSTMLRCIAAGIYNKCPGDGREFCVTVEDAVTVRAEDGRYVNNCNVSAFIANLPILPGITTALDTTHFSTGEASGSTSQAANVVEAIEMGASAFLVDEDVSAANFMARDGRMRAMVMDESITPLLYRVNGLYQSHGISSIVVVGGVGDWLDVPHQVILMHNYLCKDATAKAKSVSKQFSHGHVQYGGRGVVHRLEWDKSGSPIPRRPTDESCRYFDSARTAVTLMEGMDAILVHPQDDCGANAAYDDDLEDECIIDMSRCEQLMGKKPQLYGTGLCVLWIMKASQDDPSLGLGDLLKRLDKSLDELGLWTVFHADTRNACPLHKSSHWKLLVETLGCVYRPRRFEVGQALTRLHGIKMKECPVEEDEAEIAAKAEAERKKQALLDMWNKRRSNK